MWMMPEFEPGLVSVIIPTYNRGALIRETLESVRAQVYRPIEVIVVDDGSTDNTRSVVDDFAASVAAGLTVRYFFQTNQGATVARNRGLVESRGEFIQFLDSDDLLRPHKLSDQVHVMRREPEVQYVFSMWEYFNPDGTQCPKWQPEFSRARESLIDLMLGKAPRYTAPLWTATGLYRRSLCLQVGPWDAAFKNGDDIIYNLRVLLLGVSYRYLAVTHSLYRVHSGERLSQRALEPESLANRLQALRRIREMLGAAGALSHERRATIGNTFARLAYHAFKGGHRRLGAELLAEGYAVAPLSRATELQVIGMAYRLLDVGWANGLLGIARKTVFRLRPVLARVRRWSKGISDG